MADEKEANSSAKMRGRPFRPGNPGRPRGSRNKTTQLIEQLAADEAEKLTRKLVQLALSGDVNCLRFCIGRLWPKPNGRPIDFELPAVQNMHDVVVAMAAISKAVGDSTVTAEEAAHLVYILDSYRKVVEVRDVIVRLDRIESRMKKIGESS